MRSTNKTHDRHEIVYAAGGPPATTKRISCLGTLVSCEFSCCLTRVANADIASAMFFFFSNLLIDKKVCLKVHQEHDTKALSQFLKKSRFQLGKNKVDNLRKEEAYQYARASTTSKAQDNLTHECGGTYPRSFFSANTRQIRIKMNKAQTDHIIYRVLTRQLGVQVRA